LILDRANVAQHARLQLITKKTRLRKQSATLIGTSPAVPGDQVSNGFGHENDGPGTRLIGKLCLELHPRQLAKRRTDISKKSRGVVACSDIACCSRPRHKKDRRLRSGLAAVFEQIATAPYYVAETSCEVHNDFFDRALVVRDRALAASMSSHFQILIDRKLLSPLPVM